MKKNSAVLLFTLFTLLSVGCGNKTSASDPVLKAEVTPTERISEVPETSKKVSTSAFTTTSAVTTTVTTTAPQPPADLKLSGSGNIEVYSEMTIGQYITDTNVEILNGDVYLNTEDTGEYEIDVKYRYNGNEFTQKMSYIVEDTTPPLLLNSGWNPYHKTGKAFDLSNYVGFVDNYDRKPSLTFTGDIDPNTAGDYPLHAIVTDSSGNVLEWDVTISVVNDVPVPPDDRERVPFEDFAAAYGGDGKRLGLDISTWQGDIDFNAVRDAGCDYVIIRAGYYYDHVVLDDHFYANIEGARAAGLNVSVYFYTTDNTIEGVREHAKWLAELLEGAPTDLPVAFDWEEFSNFQQYGMNIHDINEIYRAFRDEMAGYGYDTMLYSSRNFLRDVWDESTKALGPVWLAHYVEDTDYDGDFYIWQQSSCGRIPGIAGDVDMNILYE